MIKITLQFVFIVFCILFLYLFLTQHNLDFLYNTILGRITLFLFIIVCITVNPLLGIVISAVVLYFYNNAYLEQMSYSSNSFPFPNDTLHNIYENIDMIAEKMKIEQSLAPKQSNRQIVLDRKYHREREEPCSFCEKMNISYF